MFFLWLQALYGKLTIIVFMAKMSRGVMSRGVKMKNKRKILLVSGIGIVIMAFAIGVTIAVSRPGTMKNSRQAASGQTTESKEKDNELSVLPIGTDTP